MNSFDLRIIKDLMDRIVKNEIRLEALEASHESAEQVKGWVDGLGQTTITDDPRRPVNPAMITDAEVKRAYAVYNEHNMIRKHLRIVLQDFLDRRG